MTLVKNHEVKDFVPRSFADIIGPFFNDTLDNASRQFTFSPKVDVWEEEKNYGILVAVPGMKKEDIKIDFQEGKLTVEGERKFEKEEKSKKYHTVETQYGSFKRSFYLPDNVNYKGIEAQYIDGILKINVPKDEKKIAKATIEVK